MSREKISPLKFSFLPSQKGLAPASRSKSYAIVNDYVLRINNLPEYGANYLSIPRGNSTEFRTEDFSSALLKAVRSLLILLTYVWMRAPQFQRIIYRHTPSLPEFLISNQSRRKLETSLQRSQCSELDNFRWSIQSPYHLANYNGTSLIVVLSLVNFSWYRVKNIVFGTKQGK